MECVSLVGNLLLFFHRLDADFGNAAGLHFHYREAAAFECNGLTRLRDVA